MELLNQLPPYNLFGLENQTFEGAKVVAIPVPYDSTSSYKSGSKDGPHAIIEASRNIELYSEETGTDISDIGIFTTEELAPNLSSPEATVEQIKKEVSIIAEKGKVPLLIGGEHTITLGSVGALLEKENDLSILYFDAHSDSRDSYLGAKVCHASVARRLMDLTENLYMLGVRSIDKESAQKYGSKILYMKDMHNKDRKSIINTLLNSLSEKVYLSIDLDVLDPSEMPSVGTPEPDGMHFNEMKEIIKGVLERKTLVGLDVVELNPIPGLVAPNYLAAKLIYMILSYSFGGV
ncbi:MAG: agmatinase [Candidatus Marsarchaeota archaeon]|jgi:agmatinase|nr:agmatinase [Candidatus Marsarchaeota archaeon]MCL5419134.1 agmatinase [Candidatus Marsarchaeota archaeon]